MPKLEAPMESADVRALEARVLALEQTNRSLIDAEVRYRTIFESEPECVKLLGADGSILAMNPAGLRMIEADDFAQVANRPLPDLVTSEYRARFRALTASVFRGEGGMLEFPIVGLKGGQRWLETHASPLRDPSGAITALLGITRDVTERRFAVERLRHQNRTYAMLSAINQLIVRERDELRIVERACRIALTEGGFAMAWIGQTDASTGRLRLTAHAGATPDSLALVDRLVGACAITALALATGAHAACNDIEHDPRAMPWRAEALARGHRAMASLPILVGGHVTGAFNLYAPEVGFFDGEELRLLDELALDIGHALEVCALDREHGRAIAELRSSEERFRLLIEHAGDLIGVVSDTGVIGFQSPSVGRVLGYPPFALVGRNAFELVHPDDAAVVAATLRQAVTTPATPISVEFRGRHLDQRWRILQAIGTGLPEPIAEGCIVINARDITDSRQLEEQLREAQKMEAVGQFAGGVAHDFNNILAVITIQAELALAADPPPRVREDLQEILAASGMAADLIRQLLLFGRRQVMQPRELDLNQVVTGLARMLQRIIGEDIDLHLRLHPGALVTRADSGMLDQVLMNLAVNARDAMPSGGQLTIETAAVLVQDSAARRDGEAPPGHYVRLSVTDTGCGISPECLGRVFEPFFTTKEPGKGTGLGLATVFGIVRQHRGWIEVQSEPGQGASFHIHLPASDARVDQAPAKAAPSARTGTETILVVEDEPAVRKLVRRLLERAGYRVLGAATGVEALAVWAEHGDEIALLLTDLVMPGGLTGQELADRLLADRPDLQVVFTSGYSVEIAGRELPPQYRESFLQKPFTADALLETVGRCLDGARRRSAGSPPHG